ncbi:hypothetical protein AGLY_011618 [Aphis glycines]|uniref:Uncharacterized protein n=1 Tax=Aphis glycines TaxID=307491 RepID=A0A6G0TAW1_APHGL|nr:hypothetical protein AGLY_011618 [Aphis glycines]
MNNDSWRKRSFQFVVINIVWYITNQKGEPPHTTDDLERLKPSFIAAALTHTVFSVHASPGYTLKLYIVIRKCNTVLIKSQNSEAHFKNQQSSYVNTNKSNVHILYIRWIVDIKKGQEFRLNVMVEKSGLSKLLKIVFLKKTNLQYQCFWGFGLTYCQIILEMADQILRNNENDSILNHLIQGRNWKLISGRNNLRETLYKVFKYFDLAKKMLSTLKKEILRKIENFCGL